MRRTKLLIVDDDEYVLQLLDHALSFRYDVITTDNPAVLAQIVRFEHPDVILCDINMPDMNGAAAARGLAGADDTRVVPVIFITDLVPQASVQKNGGVLGGRPALSKSAPIAEFVDTIEKVLQNTRAPESLPASIG